MKDELLWLGHKKTDSHVEGIANAAAPKFVPDEYVVLGWSKQTLSNVSQLWTGRKRDWDKCYSGCHEDGVFIGTLYSNQFGPSLAFSFPLASKQDAKDVWHWCACLLQASKAEGPRVAPARDSSAGKPTPSSTCVFFMDTTALLQKNLESGWA